MTPAKQLQPETGRQENLPNEDKQKPQPGRLSNLLKLIIIALLTYVIIFM